VHADFLHQMWSTTSMRESGTYGSVRGAPSNGRPYRNAPAVAAIDHLLPTVSQTLAITSHKLNQEPKPPLVCNTEKTMQQ
jgi:hypothetical protein